MKRRILEVLEPEQAATDELGLVGRELSIPVVDPTCPLGRNTRLRRRGSVATIR